MKEKYQQSLTRFSSGFCRCATDTSSSVFFCIPLFSINWNLKTVGRSDSEGRWEFLTATCRRPRSQWWAVTHESLLVYRSCLERCCAAAVTWPSVFSLIPILTFLAGGRGPSLVRLRLHSWDFQVSVFVLVVRLFVSLSSLSTVIAYDSQLPVI